MSKFTSVIVAVAVIGIGATGSVTAATAAPSGGSSAQDTVNQLEADGYSVQLNGSPTGSLSMCTATGIHGLPDEPALSGQPLSLTTVYVDLDCMSDN